MVDGVHFTLLLRWTQDKAQVPIEKMDQLFSGMEIPEMFEELENEIPDFGKLQVAAKLIPFSLFNFLNKEIAFTINHALKHQMHFPDKTLIKPEMADFSLSLFFGISVTERKPVRSAVTLPLEDTTKCTLFLGNVFKNAFVAGAIDPAQIGVTRITSSVSDRSLVTSIFTGLWVEAKNPAFQ
jgi:hypothetical protein